MFAAGQPRRLRDRAQAEGEIKIPGIGGFKLGPKAGDPSVLPDLGKVIAELEGSDRAPKWFTDDTVQPGQWVHFEAPLSYITIHRVVTFLDPPHPRLDYPYRTGRRLMLYGSAGHLIGESTVQVSQEQAKAVDTNNGSHFNSLRQVLFALDALYGAQEDGVGDPNTFKRAAVPPDIFWMHLDLSLHMLDQYIQADATAAWMAGYARTTALLPNIEGSTILLATPLYVEYVSQPSSDLR